MFSIKKVALVALSTTLTFALAGCGIIDDTFGGEGEAPVMFTPTVCVKSVYIDNTPGWFERNAVDVYFDSEFSSRQIRLMTEALNDLHYEHGAGMKFNTHTVSRGNFPPETKDNGERNFGHINVIKDVDYEKTDKVTLSNTFSGNAIVGFGQMRSGRMGNPGIVGANPTKEESVELYTQYQSVNGELKDYTIINDNVRLKERIVKNEVTLYGGNIWLHPYYRLLFGMRTKGLFLHELFHVLGFGHIDGEWAGLMSSKNVLYTRQSPSEDDIDMFDELYPSGSPITTHTSYDKKFGSGSCDIAD